MIGSWSRTVISLAVVCAVASWFTGDWRTDLANLAEAGLLDDLLGRGGDKADVPLPPVPPAYASKRMPPAYWTDPQVIEEGRKIYMGLVNSEVKCAKCHGEDGKPVKQGARDFRDSKKMNRISESFWLWRVSEGVPKTKMPAWKEKLTEEQIWKVMAFEHTFSHGGKVEAHAHAGQVNR